jgi:hypothetical protein
VPPRPRTTHESGERRATWLELFFDLVFVVAITQLSHELVVDHSTAGFLRFAALFVPVFVAWQGYTFYSTRFDTDDLALRVAYFAAMLAIAAMAVVIDDVAHGDPHRRVRDRLRRAALVHARALLARLACGTRGRGRWSASTAPAMPPAWRSGWPRWRSTPRPATSSGAWRSPSS